MKTLSTPASREARHAHDEIAALLSKFTKLAQLFAR